MPVDGQQSDPLDLIKAQQDIAALKMIIQVMLVFMTEGKDGKAYDQAMITRMRDSLLGVVGQDPPEEIAGPSHDLFMEGVKAIIHQVLDPLSDAK